MTKIVVFDVMVMESLLFQNEYIYHFSLKREKKFCVLLEMFYF